MSLSSPIKFPNKSITLRVFFGRGRPAYDTRTCLTRRRAIGSTLARTGGWKIAYLVVLGRRLRKFARRRRVVWKKSPAASFWLSGDIRRPPRAERAANPEILGALGSHAVLGARLLSRGVRNAHFLTFGAKCTEAARLRFFGQSREF